MSIQVSKISRDEYERVLGSCTPNPPIEQLPVWQEYDSTTPGRSFWGYICVSDGAEPVACGAFMQFQTHGYRFLRSRHGLVWAHVPSKEEEEAVLGAVAAFVRADDAKQIFIRFAVQHESALTRPCLSTLPYDATVVIDLTGGDDEILARMKPRGRRDVRKALRECTLSFSDETARATESFDEYYEVMVETAERDGFTPAPESDYRNMLTFLGPEHCRLFAGRDGDRVITWTIATISGTRATRYYGASRTDPARFLATDRLIYFECCELGKMGCTEYDQMGIGSEFQPAMMSLNTFKTKFAKDGVRPVAPDRDLPVKRGFYNALVAVKSLRDKVRPS